MGKIGQEKASKITFDEADAMATFWHEITHNRHILAEFEWYQEWTKEQIKAIEMINEFVARKTLLEFYMRLGAKEIPFPEFMKTRASTGYNKMVTNYDFVIDTLKLDSEKVLDSAKKGLFTGRYDKQLDGECDIGSLR